MGYTTDFSGAFNVTPTLKAEHIMYLKQFSETRRMKRDAKKASKLSDPIREAVKLPVGPEGAYFVGGKFSLDRAPDIVNHNRPPQGQPGLWCQWVPSEDGTIIEWDQGEKFSCYIEWIQYLITHFLAPWGYALTGGVEWYGEEASDRGRIVIRRNAIEIQTGQIEFKDSRFIPAPPLGQIPAPPLGQTNLRVELSVIVEVAPKDETLNAEAVSQAVVEAVSAELHAAEERGFELCELNDDVALSVVRVEKK